MSNDRVELESKITQLERTVEALTSRARRSTSVRKSAGDDGVGATAASLQAQGVCCIPNAVPAEAVEHSRDAAAAALAACDAAIAARLASLEGDDALHELARCRRGAGSRSR